MAAKRPDAQNRSSHGTPKVRQCKRVHHAFDKILSALRFKYGSAVASKHFRALSRDVCEISRIPLPSLL
jgi:hypothetical protein